MSRFRFERYVCGDNRSKINEIIVRSARLRAAVKITRNYEELTGIIQESSEEWLEISADNLNIEVNKIAKTIASKSPLVTRVIKKQINYARDHSVKESLDYHAAWNSSLISGSDMQEAMTSYMNKTDGTYDDLEELKSFWEKNEGLV
mgnify:CR=1 FL=1